MARFLCTIRFMPDLRGKSVLITGAARRIGLVMAQAFADAGADVAITYNTSQPEAERALADLKSRTQRALALPCDVRDPLCVTETVKKVVAEFGGLDVLVNNAAVYETVKFEEITGEQWDRMFNTNTRGPFLVTQAAAPALRKSKGRVINIGSLGGLRPWATHAHYCASKAALNMLTETMAKALAPEIAVNCVAPGMINPDNSPLDDFGKRIAERTPMKRAGTSAEVAEVVLFLSTASHFLTGQVIAVDGGLSLD
jgi:NAD(P)-dependent dehydrogenase (short-subunit alcohol dehydrogenase family)